MTYMCVYVTACVYVRLFVCLSLCVSVCVYVCVCVCLCVGLLACDTHSDKHAYTRLLVCIHVVLAVGGVFLCRFWL